MSNDLNTLRAALFDTLEALRRAKDPMPIERAKAVGEIAQTIINTAKIELEHMRLTKSPGTGFIPALSGPENEEDDESPAAKPPTGTSTTERTARGTYTTVTQIPGATVTRHRMV